MNLTIKQNNVEIIVSKATAEECILVLKEGVAPVFNIEVPVKPDFPKEANTYEGYTDVLVVDEEVEPVIAEPEVKKKLVFFKCSHCNNTFCKMVDINNPEPYVVCNCGSHLYFNLDSLATGKYECTCGTTGVFLMQENVDKVRCKGCKSNLFMIYDSDTNAYTGQTF